MTPATTAASSEGGIAGVVVYQYWGTPGVDEAGWLLVEITDGTTIDSSSQVALYVPFAVVRWCDRADADGYYKLVSTLAVTFLVEPLIGGDVAYPENQPAWHDLPRRNAVEIRACPTSGAQAAGVLADQRATWEAAGLRTYQYRLSWNPMWVGDFLVSVVDGMPAGIEPADPSIFEGLSEDEREIEMSALPATIDELFDLLEHAVDAERFEVIYDPEFGFPVEARIDHNLLAIDDELEFRVTELRTG